VLDVMKAADEPLTLNLCLLSPETCDRRSLCPVHDLWVEAKDKVEEIFSRRTVADLARERIERLTQQSETVRQHPS
jgi:Rrf2 family transcriptional regulator, iron-sulfur cluster assembly transcription factor